MACCVASTRRSVAAVYCVSSSPVARSTACAHALAVGGELLEELQALADLEDRHVDVRPVLELEERQRRLAGDRATVDVELVEEERHQVEVAALAGRRRARALWRRRACALLDGLPDRPGVEEAEVADLLLDAVLVAPRSRPARRSRTVRPFLSRTTTSRRTTSVSTRKTSRRSSGGGSGGGWANAGAASDKARASPAPAPPFAPPENERHTLHPPARSRCPRP